MLRFIIKRQYNPGHAMADETYFETIDADVPELEVALKGGGYSSVSYDMRTLIGAEVLPTTHPGAANG